jgi:SAM-dependent methyltransferase
MNIHNQSNYWNKVGQTKTFTHPLNLALLSKYISFSDKIVDFGCGYGRTVQELTNFNFKNSIGFDTSKELIERGQRNGISTIFQIENIETMPLENNSVDCFLLFAVLTCIPANAAQENIINTLHSKLKTGRVIYISDYYLQENFSEAKKYEYLNGDKDNFGAFNLPEGVIFRHHTKEWISKLTKEFKVMESNMIDVKTMNGSDARAFQLIIRK